MKITAANFDEFLLRNNLLSEEYKHRISRHVKYQLILNILGRLEDAGLVNESNFLKITSLQPNEQDYLYRVEQLINPDIFSQNLLDAVLINSPTMLRALKTLENAKLLTESNVEIISAHKTSASMAQALVALQKYNMFSDSVIKALKGYSLPSLKLHHCKILKDDNLLTEENLLFVMPDPGNLSRAIVAFHRQGFLSEYKDKLPGLKNTAVFLAMQEKGLLGRIVLNRIFTRPTRQLVINALYGLEVGHELTQEKLEFVLHSSNERYLPEIYARGVSPERGLKSFFDGLNIKPVNQVDAEPEQLNISQQF